MRSRRQWAAASAAAGGGPSPAAALSTALHADRLDLAAGAPASRPLAVRCGAAQPLPTPLLLAAAAGRQAVAWGAASEIMVQFVGPMGANAHPTCSAALLRRRLHVQRAGGRASSTLPLLLLDRARAPVSASH